MNGEYYIIWTKVTGEDWKAQEITGDMEIVTEFITETNFDAIMVERITLDKLEFRF